jgi:phospholipase/lecithinase/hemolysin
MIYRQLQFLCGTLLVLALQITTDCRAAVNVFGDSLSERGNFFLASGGAFPPTPPYYEGRISNGPAWIEYFACALGEEVPLPSVLGGTNFAFNGARAAGPSPYSTPDLAMQVASYLDTKVGTTDPDDVFVIWAGANDIFFGALAGETNFIPEAITNISGSIRRLHAAGARKFVVLDLPLLGQTPFFNTVPLISSQLDTATLAFNSYLAGELQSLKRKLNHIRIADAKVSQLFETIKRAPRYFGLRNVTDSATVFDPVTGIGFELVPGVNPNHYLFWDSVHPTTQGHKIIAAYAFLEFRFKVRR